MKTTPDHHDSVFGSLHMRATPKQTTPFNSPNHQLSDEACYTHIGVLFVSAYIITQIVVFPEYLEKTLRFWSPNAGTSVRPN